MILNPFPWEHVATGPFIVASGRDGFPDRLHIDIPSLDDALGMFARMLMLRPEQIELFDHTTTTLLGASFTMGPHPHWVGTRETMEGLRPHLPPGLQDEWVLWALEAEEHAGMSV